MNESLRQSMASLHTWTGLLLGWLLFAMFVSGTAAYFQEEITRWMQPEVSGRASPERATEAAVAWLEKKAPEAKNWFITPPGKSSATTQVFWVPAERKPGMRRGDTSAVLDGAGLILWTAKRRQRLPDPARPHLGFRIVERLNIAVVAGYPAAVAGYFLANRLLPLSIASRAEWEIYTLFLTWGAILLWTILRPARRGWIEGLGLISWTGSLSVGALASVALLNRATARWKKGSDDLTWAC
ncbi:MAG: PepSY domain-containing protein [Sphingobium sp.]